MIRSSRRLSPSHTHGTRQRVQFKEELALGKGIRWSGWAAGGVLAAWMCWQGVGYTADPEQASSPRPLAKGAGTSQPRTAREFLFAGKAHFQQGRYADAADALESALSAPGQLSDADRRQLSDLLTKARAKRDELPATNSITARGQSADGGSASRIANRSDWRTDAPGSDRATALKLLAEARAAAEQGDLDTAAKLALKAKSLPVRWNPAEESPTKFLQSLASIQNHKSSAGKTEVAANTNIPAVDANTRPEQRRAVAQQWLAEGRRLLKEGQFEESELLAKKAVGLQVQYRLLEDSPEKLLEDLRDARQVAAAKGQRSTKSNAGSLAATNHGNATNGTDALHDRADALLRQARLAHNQGNVTEALRLANGAADMERAGLVKYQPGEVRPSDYVKQLQSAAKSSVPASHVAAKSPPRISPAGERPDEEPLATPEALEQRLEASSAAEMERLASDPKALAQELLKQARADLKAGRGDEARKKVIEANQLDVSYTLFEDRPELVLADIDRVTGQTSTLARKQPASPNASPANSTLVDRRVAAKPKSASPDKQQALQLVQQARSDIQEGRVDDARAKLDQARELKVVYDLFDDRPELALADLERLSKTKYIAKSAPEQAAPPANKVAARRIPDTVAEEPVVTVTAGKTKPVARGSSGDAARAQQLLKEARSAMTAGNAVEARAKAEAARALNTTYNLFDDQPELVLAEIDKLQQNGSGRKAIAKTMPEEGPSSNGDSVEVAANEPKPIGNAAEAEQLLKAARAALAAGKINEAKLKVAAARKLDVAYGLFDDHPDLVQTEIEKKEQITAKPKASGQPVTADSAKPAKRTSPDFAQARQLIDEARQAMQDGHVEEAQAKAQAAQKLNVAFGLLDDRPELVLADIEKAKRIANIASNNSPAKAAADAMPDAAAADDADVAQSGRPISDADVVSAGGPTVDVTVIHPEGESAPDLFNIGLKALRAGQRDKAYEYFLRAHQSGQQLDRFRAQQLQDFLVTLAPRNSKGIRQAGAQVPSVESTGIEPRPIDIVADHEAAKLDKFRTEVLNATFKAEKLAPTNPEAAYKLLDDSLASIENSDLSQEAATPLVRTLQRARQEIDAQAKLTAPKRELAARNTEVKERIKLEEQTKVRVGQELAEKTEQFNDLMKQHRYAEAEVVAKQAKELDPENPTTVIMELKSKYARRNASNDDLRDRKERGVWQSLDDVEQSLVIPEKINAGIVYPDAKGWNDLTKRRSKYGRDNRIRTEEELRIEKSLNREVSLHFENAPLREVIKHLVAIAGVNVVLDDLGLEDAGITTDTPVTINVDGIRLKSALNLLLDPLRLGYTIKDEVLKITSHARRRDDLIVTTYSVADLVINLANTPQPMGSLGSPGSVIQNPQRGMAVSYGGQMNVAPLGGLQRPANQAFAQIDDRGASMANATRGSFGAPAGNQQVGMAGGGVQADFQPLIDLITATVSPDSWDSVGGEGNMTQFDQTLSLVIRQTAAVHDEIADLLNQLRRLQDLQVTIEVRIITVDDNFFERIGVDFEFNVQNTVGGPDPATFGQFLPPFGNGTSFTQAQAQAQAQQGQQAQQQQQQQAGGAGGFTPSPPRDLTNRSDYRNVVVGLEPVSGNPIFTNSLDIPFRQGSFALGIPTFGGAQNAPNAGLSVGLAILNDIETFLLVTAAQGDTRTNVMQAPKVTLFNGQQASVFVGQLRNFVTSVTPTVGLGSVGLQPQISRLFDGVGMQVTAVISADRRYVRLGVTPQITAINGVDTFTFQGGAGGQAGQAGQAGGGQIGGQGGGVGGGIGGGIGGGQFGIGGIGGIGGVGGVGGQQAQAGAFAPTITLQQPRQDIVTVFTTVSVPDGGTVLLGGVKRLAEGRNMFGVPILNKIPYISRLFKNTGVGRETRSLMMMVTPRIIIQEEEEQLLGIPM